jgi:hypothetical protein
MSTREHRTSDDGMAEFGYSQRLDRSIGKFASFAAGLQRSVFIFIGAIAVTGLVWYAVRGRRQVDTLPERMARQLAEAHEAKPTLPRPGPLPEGSPA